MWERCLMLWNGLGNYDSAIQGYKESPIIKGSINSFLREKHPERFSGIDEEFSQKLAAIDEDIARLRAKPY